MMDPEIMELISNTIPKIIGNISSSDTNNPLNNSVTNSKTKIISEITDNQEKILYRLFIWT